MKIAIMQPTYLPWMGYFEMILKCDVFLFLDSVQFERKSWQQRNYVRSGDKKVLLTVPVETAGRFGQKISDVKILRSPAFPRKHLQTIKFNYSRAPFFQEIFPILEKWLDSEDELLATVNMGIVEDFARYLNSSVKFVRASSLQASGTSTNLTVNQCVELNASEFYSAEGSRSYVSIEQGFKSNNILVSYQNYKHPGYKQLGSGFISHLSVTDLLMNHGRFSRKIILQEF
jgi:hypothetical protein